MTRNAELVATIQDLERQKSELQNQVNDILGSSCVMRVGAVVVSS